MSDKDNNSPKWSRRSVIKGLGGVPLLGAAWWAGKRFADEVIGKRETSRPDVGIVWVHTKGFNQRDEMVQDAVQAFLLQRRPA